MKLKSLTLLTALFASSLAFAGNFNTSEVRIGEPQNQIYGKLYQPENAKGKQPIIIYSHGLGGTHEILERFAKAFAEKGITGYAIDYRGGGEKSQSSGKTTEMSVLTEIRDLEEVIATVRKWDFVDPNKIVLLGESQGGAVSMLTAAKNADEIAGLVAYYPALSIQDDARKNHPNFNKIPDVERKFGIINLGKIYYTDAYNLNAFDKIVNYRKPMLLLHGSKDPIVANKYSQQAHSLMPNSEFHLIDGAGHSFDTPKHFPIAFDYTEQYLKKIGVMK